MTALGTFFRDIGDTGTTSRAMTISSTAREEKIDVSKVDVSHAEWHRTQDREILCCHQAKAANPTQCWAGTALLSGAQQAGAAARLVRTRSE